MLPVKYWKFSSPVTRRASSSCSAIAALALAQRFSMSAFEKADHCASFGLLWLMSCPPSPDRQALLCELRHAGATSAGIASEARPLRASAPPLRQGIRIAHRNPASGTAAKDTSKAWITSSTTMITGRHFDDLTVLQVADAVEKSGDWKGF